MTFLIASFYFFYFSVVGIYVIFIPKVLAMVGYTPSDIGIILAAAPLVRFLLPFFFIKFITLNTKLFHIAIYSESLPYTYSL